MNFRLHVFHQHLRGVSRFQNKYAVDDHCYVATTRFVFSPPGVNTLIEIVYKPTRCQNPCDYTLFFNILSTFFGLYQSVFRSNLFYKLYVVFATCRYHTCGCCVPTATQQPHVSTYTKYDIQLIKKIAPEDGLIQSKKMQNDILKNKV